ncbi:MULTISPECIES: GDP-mannose pyrophosphatase NudK [Sodalis]|jgi:GDP-mannose pyrophosphatase NudK|uniref:GDP-mannose pyrophosphatase n=1 Tax=Sodalis ligni TaxID=2697027 RepID=A0A4R1NRL6_9GAMM|nr:GDP-mannose pyrophosphatase NudK [Sodalis ligni]TCL07080.1 GDP-mannose pyrophosphatase NudK [Sodalis ligni]
MPLNIKILENKLLSDHWFVLRKLVFSLQKKDGTAVQQMREVYDRGNGATILLYNSLKNTLVLIRQFRMPTYMNGNPTGMLLETCAGLLDDDSPEECIRREAIEETGYAVGKVEKLFSAYMSPGGVTEIVHFFAAEYDESSRDNEGGGIEDEDIEVVELTFGEALAMVRDGRIRDGKTIMLLQHAQLKGWLKA